LRLGLRGEVSLADGRLVVVVAGRGAAFELTGPGGIEVATVKRAGRTWLRATGAGCVYAEVERELNTLTAVRAGTAHPNSFVIRFDQAISPVLRLGILAAGVMIENQLRG
jgi:hypothetical protein